MDAVNLGKEWMCGDCVKECEDIKNCTKRIEEAFRFKE
jgi:hypothetical protein